MSLDAELQQKSMAALNESAGQPSAACFHCGETLPSQGVEFLTVYNTQQPMCCSGCKAVAQIILDAGLGDYYLHRKEFPKKITDTNLLASTDWQAFDNINTELKDSDRVSEVLLDIEGMHCVSCAWLVQNRLEEQGDVKVVSLDHQTGIAIVRWDANTKPLSSILHSINTLGYLPHVLEQEESGELLEELSSLRSEDSLKRLAVAGLGMMQVMMFAVALYTGDAMNMENVYRRFLIWVSMLVTFPVLFYSGMPFLRHAWQSLCLHRMHMDIPISIALLSAFSLSVVNSFLGSGEVYFDSVVMFVFFLSVSRYIQERITRRMITSRQAFSRMLPVLVEVEENGRTLKKPSAQIRAGEKIAVAIGGVIPADGRIVSGNTDIDAAWLSGESRLIPHTKGDEVFAGMINVSQPIQILVSKDARHSAISILSQRLRRSEYVSSEHKSFVSRYVTLFVAFTLLVAGSAFSYWVLHGEWHYGFEIALAVLVVSCPCALAIAMPSSVASLATSLHDLGIYVINPAKLLNLTRISCVVLDKTGTLTNPEPRLQAILNQQDKEKYLAYARALSNFTQHPKARFLQSEPSEILVRQVEETRGLGISGIIDGRRYFLGRADYAASFDVSELEQTQAYLCFGDGQSCFLQWKADETLRAGARSLVSQLHKHGLKSMLCSGDHFPTVKKVAEQLGIEKFYAAQSGEQKLELIRALQNQDEVVLSIGDGVNDAEFLQQADLSISFTNASELAQANADILIADQDLSKIELLLQSANKLTMIYKQNLTWAISYNLLMLPLAVLGFIQPWIAALGMSLSSLFVVTNSLRLSRRFVKHPNSHLTEALTI